MRITVARYAYLDEITRGIMFIGGKWNGMHTLEEQKAENAVERRKAGEEGFTCIPEDTYPARIRPASESNRFNYDHIQLLDVEPWEDILIHAGNWDRHVTGCIMPGMTAAPEGENMATVGLSREAMRQLMNTVRGHDFDVRITHINLA